MAWGNHGPTVFADLGNARIDDRPAHEVIRDPAWVRDVFEPGVSSRGEKLHEILVSEEECYRTSERDGYYVIHSILPELDTEPRAKQALHGAFSSADALLDRDKVRKVLSMLIAARDEEAGA